MQIVDVTIDFSDPERGAAEMSRRADTLASVFQALKRPARQDQEDHAQKAMGSDGPWPRRAQATLDKLNERAARVVVSRRKRRNWNRGTQVTIRTTKRRVASTPLGILPKAIRYSARGDALVAKSAIARGWGSAHQQGATVGRGSRLPAREFLWFSDRFLEVMTEAIELHVIRGWDPSVRLERLRLSL